LVQGNYIYNIGQHILCDQGGIYTLGLQPGTVISNNVFARTSVIEPLQSVDPIPDGDLRIMLIANHLA
jgi:hypothetical protein